MNSLPASSKGDDSGEGGVGICIRSGVRGGAGDEERDGVLDGSSGGLVGRGLLYLWTLGLGLDLGLGFRGRREEKVGGGGEGTSWGMTGTTTSLMRAQCNSSPFCLVSSSASCCLSISSPSPDMGFSSSLSSSGSSFLASHPKVEATKGRRGVGARSATFLMEAVLGRGIRGIIREIVGTMVVDCSEGRLSNEGSRVTNTRSRIGNKFE